ncbi:MAG TPA: GTP cyclohydrolase II [Polyangia bacterium]|jgi:GTP cyclohydrolase II
MSGAKERLAAIVGADRDHACAGVAGDGLCVRALSVAELPSRFGDFLIVAFGTNRDAKGHLAVVRGDVVDGARVPTRLHSECLTGDALGSLRCDCRDQLEAALRRLGTEERGLLLYLRQEGRGIGLINKIRAYELQDQGLDTNQANRALGFADDERDYAIAAHMLATLRVRSVELMTNNPDKIAQLARYGVQVDERIPHVMPSNRHNRLYLETKVRDSGHLMGLRAVPRVAEPEESGAELLRLAK